MELRFIIKKGEKVLQSRQFLGYTDMPYSFWQDIPTEESSQNERQQVCDEIIEGLKIYSTLFGTYGFADIMKTIKRVRDK
ncbi:MAG: hypothetical protein ABIG69_04090 [Bacteroidota bacterium]